MRFLIYALVILSFSVQAENVVKIKGHQNLDLQVFMKDFFNNPKAEMNKLPAKVKAMKEGVIDFSTLAEDLTSFLEVKLETRQDFLIPPEPVRGMGAIEWNDRAENIVDNAGNAIRNVYQIDARRLQDGRVTVHPWSGDYWAIAEGGIHRRYTDPHAPQQQGWQAAYQYYSRNHAWVLINQGRIDQLSPSEKYDLLMGDTEFSLSRKALTDGRSYFQQSGHVEPWMGICHGWAVAAIQEPAPVKAVEVMDVHGRHKIKFRPSDIRALASQLYAYSHEIPLKPVVGGRCNKSNAAGEISVATDSNGRVLDQECFDNNPGTFHIALANQVGLLKRSFIMDATFDYEVWNHPIQRYSIRYFNPQNPGQVTYNAQQVMIPVHNYTRDPFKAYRSPHATYVVGVTTSVDYVIEMAPMNSDRLQANYDTVQRVHYRYDLELDAHGNIIGGEWYSNAHPDFLWGTYQGRYATTSFDRNIHGNTMAEIVKAAAPYAKNTSKQLGVPLSKVVRGLIERAK